MLISATHPPRGTESLRSDLPFVINRLNDKSERRAHRIHVFIHETLHNGSLAGVVKTARSISAPSLPAKLVPTASRFASPCPLDGLSVGLQAFFSRYAGAQDRGSYGCGWLWSLLGFRERKYSKSEGSIQAFLPILSQTSTTTHDQTPTLSLFTLLL